jgi:hypothetical protein
MRSVARTRSITAIVISQALDWKRILRVQITITANLVEEALRPMYVTKCIMTGRHGDLWTHF